MIDVCGPYLMYTKPRASQAVTRAAAKTRRDQLKLFVLLGICMYSHRVEAAVLDSMRTGSLQSGLNQIMGNNGWSTVQLSLDPGSSLIPMAKTLWKSSDNWKKQKTMMTSKNKRKGTTWSPLQPQRLLTISAVSVPILTAIS